MARKIRYAVVGLGHISQNAVLPAFANARRNSELVALVSGDEVKLKQLSRRYRVPHVYNYEEFDRCLEEADIDAVYLATPNTEHRRFAEVAARRGVHILCEKPLTATVAGAAATVKAARDGNVKLMVAYRLHFDAANLEAIELARNGKLGDLRIFQSLFTMQVKDRGNIRLDREKGGGPLFDIGIYCINAARYLFRDEPIEVFAMSSGRGKEARFSEVEEMTSAILRFPKDRLATFTASFGAEAAADYELVGTQGRLRLRNAYEYEAKRELQIIRDEKVSRRMFPKTDQFGPELLYFSDCILKRREPEPSGAEGLADLRIIEALLESARIGRPVSLRPEVRKSRPTARQRITKPAVSAPRMVHARAAS